MYNFLYPKFDFKFQDGRLVWDMSEEELQDWIDDEMARIRQDEVWQLANQLFTEDDKPSSPGLQLSPAELEIFKLVFFRSHPRAQVSSSTQYGKTLTIGKGVLTRLATFEEDWLLIEPDMKRGRIILNYIVKATAANNYFKQKLIGVPMEDRSALNRLLEEKSKVKLTYQIMRPDGGIGYSSVEILSAEAHRRNEVMEAVMGFGGKNVISDESSLLDDVLEAGVFRMLAGKGTDTFYLKIGNNFYRNHFFRSWKSPRYAKVFVDYRIGLADGRYTPEFIAEAKTKPRFDVLFANLFPREGVVDKLGYISLWTQAAKEKALVGVNDLGGHQLPMIGRKKAGIDPAGAGRNYSTLVLRTDNAAKLVMKLDIADPLIFAAIAVEFILKEKIKPEDVAVDMTGDTACYREIRRLLGDKVLGIVFGSKPEDDEAEKLTGHFYLNRRAQMYDRAAEWTDNGGKIIEDPDGAWDELEEIKYKINADKNMQLMSKEEMAALGIESPDVADAFALTFATKSRPMRPAYKQKERPPLTEHGG